MKIREQIEVLKEAKKTVKSVRGGLCLSLRLTLYGYGISIPTDKGVREIIPIFTYENACKFDPKVKNKRKSDFWWSRCSVAPRCKFIDWMISELEKQLKNEEDENI